MPLRPINRSRRYNKSVLHRARACFSGRKRSTCNEMAANYNYRSIGCHAETIVHNSLSYTCSERDNEANRGNCPLSNYRLARRADWLFHRVKIMGRRHARVNILTHDTAPIFLGRRDFLVLDHLFTLFHSYIVAMKSKLLDIS